MHGDIGHRMVLLPGVTMWSTVAAGHIRFHPASITTTRRVILRASMSSIQRQNAEKSVVANTEDLIELTSITVSK
ncbi:unnamed protein product [Gongylonema pulchrum]|uniref:Secreted protein n=1 Tax=Gongylonema pulchrum TaxID=637853 RepID=A0A183DMR3_9BILA|nr:unnamed protein product [Gongylonema pulchrum]